MHKMSALVVLCILAPSCALDESQPEIDAESAAHLSVDVTRGDHCVIETDAVPNDEADRFMVDSNFEAELRCFPEFAQAIEFATGGRVKLPHDAIVDDVDDELLNGNPNDLEATYVIGIEYEHAFYGGATLTYTSSVTCNGYTLWTSSMPSGWNDVISSARAFSGCNHSYHYEHNYQGGAVVDCWSSCSYIGGAMNDRTSSIRWTR